MKKLLFGLFGIFLSPIVFGQIYLPTQNNSGNTNVGIGTNAHTPSARLQVSPSGTTGLLLLNAGTGMAPPGGEPPQTEYLIRGTLNSGVKFDLSPAGTIDMAGELHLGKRINLEYNGNHFLEFNYVNALNGLSLLWNNLQTTGYNNNLTFRFGTTTSASALFSLSPTGNLALGTDATANRLHIKNTAAQDIFTVSENGHVTISHFNTPNGTEPIEGVYGLTVKNDGFRAHDFAFEVESAHGKILA